MSIFIVTYLSKSKKPQTKKFTTSANSSDDASFNFRKSGIKYLKVFNIKESTSNCLGNIFPDLQNLKDKLENEEN